MHPFNNEPLQDPILSGRDSELEELKRFLDRAISGEGSIVFISGEAGTGKTRLVKEFLKKAEKTDAIILKGWCQSETAIPYFPFVEAFDSYLSLNDNAQAQYNFALNQNVKIKSWLSTIDPPKLITNIQDQPQVWKDRAFFGVAEELMLLAEKKVLILFLDDIHWADSASLSLLQYLARKVCFERILILASFRSEQLEINSRNNKSQLSMMLLSMDRDDLFSEIKLKNLQKDDVKKIAESMLKGKVDSDLVAMLTADCHGNPLYIVETIRMLYQKKSLFKKDGRWNFRIDNLEIPRKVKDIIQRRLETLKPLERKILDMASVVGEKFDPKLVAALVKREYPDVLIALNNIEKHTLIVHSEGNGFRFEHAKFCEMLYQKIPTLLKREYHFSVGKEMEAINLISTKFSASEIASHFIKSDNKMKTIEYSLKAGKDSLSQFSNVEAINYFSCVIDFTRNNAELLEEQELALEGLGDAYIARCMYEEAIKTFNQLANSQKGVIRLRALRKAMEAAFIKGDKPDLLLEYAKRAEDLQIYDPLEMGRIIKNKGRAYAWAGRGDSKLDLINYQTALGIFEEENSLFDIADVLWRIGEATFSLEGLGYLLRARSIFRELADIRKEISVSRAICTKFILLEQFSEARVELEKVIRTAEKIGAVNELARSMGLLGSIDQHEGKYREAISKTEKALEYIKKTDVKYLRSFNLGALIRLHSKLGNIQQADEYFEKIMKLPQEILKIGMVPFTIGLTKGVYLTSKGLWSESLQVFESLPSSLLKDSPFIRDYIWVLEKQGKIDRAKLLKEKAQKKRKETQKSLRNANIQIYILAPKTVSIGKIFEIRLDLVNVSTEVRTLGVIEGLLTSGCKIVSMPLFCSVQNDSIEFNNRLIKPFHVESMKIRMSFIDTGDFDFKPCLHYTTESGEKLSIEAKPITLNVKLDSSIKNEKLPTPFPKNKFEDTSKYTKKVFNYLVKAFENDYQIKKMPINECGWRTRMEIVRNTKVTMYSIYGRTGRGGKVTSELTNRSLVESRFFFGERGRGGKVLKMRICYDEGPLKNLISKSGEINNSKNSTGH